MRKKSAAQKYAEVNADREAEIADACDASFLDGDRAYEAAMLVVPAMDLLSRIGMYGERERTIFFAYLSRFAESEHKDDEEIGRAAHGVVIALREYAEACRR